MKALAGVMVMAVAIAACSPEELATDLTRSTARTVVLPVVRDAVSPPADTLATECILNNATNAELNVLARNVGNSAGTLTIQTIRTIAERPATRACLAGQGLPPLVL
ncbi:MAG: hypothetical protein IOD05_14925 [Rhodobacter sp.]|nr:hypothetical protein [Rhodobacter sp.]MCA3494077.1 hypothetical protein [Rhodobacter sp.]MCA3500315.1 hypothetical protein [Rhodobacter sp.]MCA3504507.1 hypothetical protein [Rhodobacter sp.]MCA3517919.1 hypothetical protein [Rhodobacter sp.]